MWGFGSLLYSYFSIFIVILYTFNLYILNISQNDLAKIFCLLYRQKPSEDDLHASLGFVHGERTYITPWMFLMESKHRGLGCDFPFQFGGF